MLLGCILSAIKFFAEGTQRLAAGAATEIYLNVNIAISP
jgi:hypothetical protein